MLILRVEAVFLCFGRLALLRLALARRHYSRLLPTECFRCVLRSLRSLGVEVMKYGWSVDSNCQRWSLSEIFFCVTTTEIGTSSVLNWQMRQFQKYFNNQHQKWCIMFIMFCLLARKRFIFSFISYLEFRTILLNCVWRCVY